ncbi:hypothetical protein HK405_015964, partial [Cladochytrium tenue]
MAAFYIFAPLIITAFDNAGLAYWTNTGLAFFATFFISAFLGWLLTKTVDVFSQDAGNFAWEWLEGATEQTPASFLAGSARKAWAGILALPSKIRDRAARKAESTRKFWRLFYRFVTSWRTITVRPPSVQPTEEEALQKGLHSSEWTADISQNKDARRTARVLKINNYMSREYFKRQPVKRPFINKFYIVTVTKGSNEEAVLRSYNAMKHLEELHPAISVIVLSDEPYSINGVNNIVCPADYVSPLGVAKHKARALAYLNSRLNLTEHCWVLHMDEESIIDAESLRQCFEFIRYTTHSIGQGTIVYNSHWFWKNWFFTVADAVRVGDDLGRFHFQYTVFERPVFGVHGSFLMTNGEVENEVGWDCSSLAEDFEFSHMAWAKGFTFGPIRGIVQEQSPT